VQRPVVRDGAPLFEARDIAVDGRHEFPTTAMAVRIVADFDAGTATRFGLDVRVGGDEATRVVVDREAGTVAVDRTGSGLVRLARRRVPPESPDFAAAEAAADGTVAISDLIFPSPGSTGIAAFADGGTAHLRSLTVSGL
jgi:sucrose-6-phosphate hydrolase SacC (GH32 family)